MSGEVDPEQATAAVIGSGPAGLAAALTLSRALIPTLVFDATAPYRNRDSPGVGGLLGRDLVMPQDLRGLGRQEIANYGQARFIDETVEALQGDAASGFLVITQAGSRYRIKTVLLASGMVDLFPEIDGLSSFWGSGIINCPFCHGFELRQRPWGVYVHRPEMLDAAEIYATWTDDLVFFLEPDQSPTPQREAELEARGYGLERRRIHRFIGDENGLTGVELEDGSQVAREGFVMWPHQRQTDLVAGLDLEIDDTGCVLVDAAFRTSQSGLYAAGDLLYQGHQNVNTAIHMGNLAAATMVMDLAKGLG